MKSRADQIIDRSIVWDNVWPLEPDSGNDFNRLPELASAGWTHLSLTVAGDDHNLQEAFRRVASTRRQILARTDELVLVETVDDIMRAKKSGRLAVSLHFEGSRCFERNIDTVEAFYRLGVKHALLAFNNPNSVGGGCAEEDSGLSKFGAKLVAELERVGMILDLSHTGYRTSMEALARATKPVIFSHSNAYEVAPHWRNIRDDQIRACAATGGLVGLSGSSEYLGDRHASTDAMFRHVDYLVGLIGCNHVGLGLDIVFDEDDLNAFVRSRPDEWPGTSGPEWPGFHYIQPKQLRELVERMLRAGYSEDVIAKLLGGNYMRICGAAWSEDVSRSRRISPPAKWR